ncbi:MAG: GNAT family N-acetyltransferase [Lentisphaeraceae bacterium]|nr:GNAT family N-acetyltransferase [Lentisphaeraceae bacterium]
MIQLSGYKLIHHDCESAKLRFLGDPLFSQYFAKESLIEARENLSKTYVLLDNKEKNVAAYFSISNDKICPELMKSNNDYKRLLYSLSDKVCNDELPAVKIKMLSVAIDYQNRGIGSNIIKSLKKTFSDPSFPPGCRLLLADTVNDAKRFYTNHGFKPLALKKTNFANPMFFDLLKL